MVASEALSPEPLSSEPDGPLRRRPKRVGLLGAHGFVGSAAQGALERHGCTVVTVKAPRLGSDPTGAPVPTGDHQLMEQRSALAQAFQGCQVVVNAAGIAAPDSSASDELFGANGLLPRIVAEAAAEAGVGRFVHVSSAAVQGRRDPLDETTASDPFSAYSAAKALGERLALAASSRPGEVVVYRPASVLGAGRAQVAQLVRLFRRSCPIPVAGGDVPLPLALVENVGEAIAVLAMAPEVGTGVVLHPSEGITVRGLRALFEGRVPIVGVPPSVARGATAVVRRAATGSPRWSALSRRLELLVLGQRQAAAVLDDLGFAPVVGREGYRRIAGIDRARVSTGRGGPRAG